MAAAGTSQSKGLLSGKEEELMDEEAIAEEEEEADG